MKQWMLLLLFTLSLLSVAACTQKETASDPPAQSESSNEVPYNNQPAPEERVAHFEAMLRSFELEPSEYVFYYNIQVRNLISIEEDLSLHEQLGLQQGDRLPGYYWSEEQQILYALKESKDGGQYLYTFQRNPSTDELERQKSPLLQVEAVREAPTAPAS